MGINFSPSYTILIPNCNDVFTMTNLTPNTHPGTSVNRGCSRYQFIRCSVMEAFVFQGSTAPDRVWPSHSRGFMISHTHTNTNTHTHSTLQESSRQLIGPSQRPIPDKTTSFTRYRHPYFRLDSKPQSHQTSGRRPTRQHYIFCRN